ncbi:MAG TPA: FkbM family methyltransferase [Caulobacteraceae bacterium]|jgi:FkbM family methyltransferase|nr:FkbM family methyltransferase [Caulobacteraceae bacterium]
MNAETQILISNSRDSWIRRVVPHQVRTAARGLINAYRNRKTIEPYWLDIEQRGAKIKFLVANIDGESWYSPYAKIENREMTFLQEKVLRPGMRVVEVGAHQGFTAALIGRWVGPEGQVFTFEPLRQNCDVASKVFAENQLDNIKLTRAAVGEESGEVYIGSTTTNPNVQTNGFLGEACPLVRLDDQIEGAVDLLKIDVEGYELHVLRGAKRLLETRPHLQIEVHPGPISDFGGSVADMFKLIDVDAYDYWIQTQSTVSEPAPYSLGKPISHNSHLFCVRKDARAAA